MVVVDIGNWNSGSATQFNLHLLPSYRLYGEDGKLQLSEDAAATWVRRQLQRAQGWQARKPTE